MWKSLLASILELIVPQLAKASIDKLREPPKP